MVNLVNKEKLINITHLSSNTYSIKYHTYNVVKKSQKLNDKTSKYTIKHSFYKTTKPFSQESCCYNKISIVQILVFDLSRKYLETLIKFKVPLQLNSLTFFSNLYYYLK